MGFCSWKIRNSFHTCSIPTLKLKELPKTTNLPIWFRKPAHQLKPTVICQRQVFTSHQVSTSNHFNNVLSLDSTLPKPSSKCTNNCQSKWQLPCWEDAKSGGIKVRPSWVLGTFSRQQRQHSGHLRRPQSVSCDSCSPTDRECLS